MMQVTIDAGATLRALGSLEKQLRFAVAGALNDTAFEARDAVRSHLEQDFIIRRPWVVQGIQVPSTGKATREKLEAELVLDSQRDFLAKFEKGGTKTARSGRDLAVPDAARPTPQALIPRQLRPRALQIADATAQGIGFRKKGGVIRKTIRQKGQGLLRTFLIPGVGILQRVGRGAASTTRLLYAFAPRATIPPDLHFERTAREVATRSFARHFERRFAEALRTAR